jgi:ubiquinone/menaquinone biosynthesis C-methylase UbiE
MFESTFLNPEEVIKELDLKDNMIAVDFGSGAGGWTIPLAKKLDEGKVYAIDVQEEMLSALKSRAAIDNLQNIETIVCDLENPEKLELVDNFFDIVLITNLLFQTKNKKQILTEAQRVLKKGGQILIVDWEKASPLGPQKEKVGSEDIKKIAESLDLKIKKEFKAGQHHYGLVFTKP